MTRLRLLAIPALLLALSACAGHEVAAPDDTSVPNFSHKPNHQPGGGAAPAPPADPAIAFSGGGGLQVMNADGSNQTLIHTATAVGSPSWSPDGKSVAFNQTVDQPFELWIIDVVIVDGRPEGQNLRNLLGAGVSGAWPAWSPNGTEIAHTDLCNLLATPAAGGSSRRIYTSPTGNCVFMPTWSPDGTMIAFEEGEAEGPSLRIVNVADAPTTVAAVIIPAGQFQGMRFQDWSRNGDRIAFAGVRPGAVFEMINTVDVATEAVTELVRGNRPTWSPNDSRLAFTIDVPGKVMVLDPQTLETTTLARGLDPDWRRF